MSIYKSHWGKFLKFSGLSGDQILASRKDDKDYAWEKKTLEFKSWLTKKGLSDNSANTGVGSVRSFFSFHRLPLNFRRGERKRLSEAKRVSEDYRFALSDLKKMCDVANLTEKYVVTAGKSFGMRAGDFLRLTRGDLEPYIDREVPISIGEHYTQKESVKAYPFIDSDALPVIKLMLERKVKEGGAKPTDRILDFKNDIELTRTIKRVAERANINTGNKVVRFHCLRKFLSDHLASHMSESKWKQIVGKKISEGAYISLDELRKDYARAMDETCFAKSEDFEKLHREVEEIKEQLGPEMVQRMRDLGIARFRKPSEKTEEEDEDCPDGKHCETQRVVSEAELPKLLSEGWQVVTALASGSVVIHRS
jgi:integrase